MRVGVYGGSFHPPHVGHAMVAAWLVWTEQVDEVWLLPTGDHPFGKRLAPFADRVRWCEALAASVGPRVKVCAVEGSLPAPSYTVDTLDHLASTHPEHAFRLVMGADLVPTTPQWRDWARIAATYDPLVVGRAGHGEVDGVPTFPEVSSTEIRERLSAGASVQGFVPAAVIEALDGWRPEEA